MFHHKIKKSQEKEMFYQKIKKPRKEMFYHKIKKAQVI
jgi:hypothetical protein